MELPQFLQHLCGMIKDLYYFAFGDKETSECKDITVSSDTEWTLLATMSKPSILFIRNLSLTQELFITWNDRDVIGGRMPKDTVYSFDRVSGAVYGKLVTAGTNVSVNTIVISGKG